MKRQRMSKKRFIGDMKALFGEDTDPFALKRELELAVNDGEKLGYAETMQYFTHCDEAADQLRDALARLPREENPHVSNPNLLFIEGSLLRVGLLCPYEGGGTFVRRNETDSLGCLLHHGRAGGGVDRQDDDDQDEKSTEMGNGILGHGVPPP